MSIWITSPICSHKSLKIYLENMLQVCTYTGTRTFAKIKQYYYVCLKHFFFLCNVNSVFQWKIILSQKKKDISSLPDLHFRSAQLHFQGPCQTRDTWWIAPGTEAGHRAANNSQTSFYPPSSSPPRAAIRCLTHDQYWFPPYLPSLPCGEV